MNLPIISDYIPYCEPQMPRCPAIFQQRSADAPSTKKPEGNSEGYPKGVRQRSSSSTSQSECEGLGRDPAPDTDRTLLMLLSKLRSNGIYNIGGPGNQSGFPPPSSPPDGADITHIAWVNCQIFLRLEKALAWLINTPYDASNSRETPWSYFNGLVIQLKQLAWINDAEYPEIGEEEIGKFLFGVLSLQASPEGSIDHISFKPKGTTSLNKSICSLLCLITGPIQLQGKLPTKKFDGPVLGSRVSGIEKLKYKRKVSEILFNQFMSAAESHWDNLGMKMQTQICNNLVGALRLLFLYWGYYLCLEKRLLLSKIDRRMLRGACLEQLKQNTLACIEKENTIFDEFPLYMVLVDNSSHSHRESPSRPRTNSIAHDGHRSEQRRSTCSQSTHTSKQRNVAWACFCNPADRGSYSPHSRGSNNIRNVQTGYHSGTYTLRFSTNSSGPSLSRVGGCTCNSAAGEPGYHSSSRKKSRFADSKI